MEVPNDGVLLQQETQEVSGSHHNLTESSLNKSFSVCEFFRVLTSLIFEKAYWKAKARLKALPLMKGIFSVHKLLSVTLGSTMGSALGSPSSVQNSAGIYLLKVSNRNTITMSEINSFMTEVAII